MLPWARQSSARDTEVRLTVAHVEDALHLPTKVSVPWRVDDVNLCALDGQSPLEPMRLMPHSQACLHSHDNAGWRVHEASLSRAGYELS